MTERADLDRDLGVWFALEAPVLPPTGLRDDIVGITGRRRPRAAWVARLSGSLAAPTTGVGSQPAVRLIVALGVLALLAAVAVASLFVGRPRLAVELEPFHATTIDLPGSTGPMLAGAGAIWVSIGDAEMGLCCETITRIDPVTNAVEPLILEPLEGEAWTATTDEAVWSAGQGRIREWDAATGRELRRWSIDYVVHGLLAAHGALWTIDLGADTVTRIDPASGELQRLVVGPEPSGVARELIDAGDAVWASVRSSDGNSFVRIDPLTLAVTPVKVPGRPVCGMGREGPLLLSANCDRSGIDVRDPATLAIRGRLTYASPLDGLMAVGVVGDDLWVVGDEPGPGPLSLVQMDPATYREVGRAPLPVTEVGCRFATIAFGSVWLATDKAVIRVPIGDDVTP